MYYNREEVPLDRVCGGSPCLLAQFRDRVLGPYLLTEEEHESECLVHFKHTGPAGERVEVQDLPPPKVGSSAVG